MPTPYIERLSKEGKGTIAELESKWDRAVGIAEEEGKGGNYSYITGIFKRMAGVKKASAADIIYFLIRKEAFGEKDMEQSKLPGITGEELASGSLGSGWPGNDGKGTYNVFARSAEEATGNNTFTQNSMGGEASRAPKPAGNQVPIASESDIEYESAKDVQKDTLPEQIV